MSRKTSRKHSFIIIFQIEFQEGYDLEEITSYYLEEIGEISVADRDFISEETKGVVKNVAEINEIISKYSTGWSIDRLNKVDLAVLRLAIFEMMFMEDIPVKVSINEAVEMSKIFGTDESPGFINGLLGSVATALESKNEG